MGIVKFWLRRFNFGRQMFIGELGDIFPEALLTMTVQVYLS